MADATKTIKVDDAVHSELNRLKGKYEVDTFNDVLRRELNIIPAADVEKLAAYLRAELRDTVQEVVEIIESVDGFNQDVKEDNYQKYLTFTSPSTERKIAEIEFREERFDVYYRDQHGEMSRAGGGAGRNDGVEYGTTGSGYYDHIDREEFTDSVEEKVAGAYRRWGEHSGVCGGNSRD